MYLIYRYFCWINKRSICKCKRYSHFFSRNVSVHAIFNDQSFNNMLTNDIVSFEQLGLGFKKTCANREGLYDKQCNIDLHHPAHPDTGCFGCWPIKKCASNAQNCKSWGAVNWFSAGCWCKKALFYFVAQFLGRRFTWNDKSYLIWKIIIKIKNVIGTLRVNIPHFFSGSYTNFPYSVNALENANAN